MRRSQEKTLNNSRAYRVRPRRKARRLFILKKKRLRGSMMLVQQKA